MSEQERLTELAEALADGVPVDWTMAESTATTEQERVAIRRLSRIEQAAARQRRAPGSARASSWSHLLLLEKIGEGAFGEVYRARDPRLDRDVALKLIDEPMWAGNARASAVIEEGRLLARVRHPNVVTVYGAECVSGRVGVWMDLIPGRTLQQVLQDHGPFGPQEAVLIGLDLCRALAAVHQAGLVHGDVKAQNIMREDGGRVVLMDFGAGRDRASPTSEVEKAAGTPLYLAPEILRGDDASPRSDLYSLGVLLYHLVTNSYPIAARTLAEVEAAHRLNKRTPLRDARSDLPLALVTVVERALASDPGARYASAGAMEGALAEALAAAREAAALPGATRFGDSTDGTSPSQGRLSGWKKWAAAAVVIAAIAAVALVSMRGKAIPFEARDWVLVAAFDNNTGEPQLNGAIEAALEYELVNSQFVNVVPRDRVDGMLKLMRKPVDTRLDTTVAREVALRDGAIRALVGGQLNKIGSSYVLTASVMAPDDGRVVESVRQQAATTIELPAALRRLSNTVREALGETRGAIKESEARLEKVTTPSIQALMLYSESYTLGSRGDWRAALDLVRRAVEDDPQFASAQIWLAWCLLNSDPRGYRPEVEAAAARAVELSRNSADWERYWIEGSQLIMTDDPNMRAEAAAKFKALLEIMPTHRWGLANLIVGLRASLRLSEAVPYALAAVRLQPNDRPLALQTFRLLVELGDPDRARTYGDAVRDLANAAGDPVPNLVLAEPVFAADQRGDVPETVRALDALEGSLSTLSGTAHDEMAGFIADWNLGLGRAHASERAVAAVADPNQREFLLTKAAFFADDLRSLRARVPLVRIGQQQSVAPRDIGQPQRLETMFYFVKAGFLRPTEAQLVEMEHLYSGPRYRERFDMLRGCISLERGDPDGAVAFLAPAKKAHLPMDSQTVWADDCLAEGRFRRGEVSEAVAALQRWELEPVFIDPARTLRALRTRNRLRLAELYHAAGRDEPARKLADYVATLLSKAEPGFPLLDRLRRLQLALAAGRRAANLR